MAYHYIYGVNYLLFINFLKREAGKRNIFLIFARRNILKGDYLCLPIVYDAGSEGEKIHSF